MTWMRVNGRVVGADEPAIPANDPGLTLGWTAFESMRVRHGQPVDLDAHMERLKASCEALDIVLPDAAVLCEDLTHTIRESGLTDLRVRLTVTAGGNRIVSAEPFDVARWGAPVRAVRGLHGHDPWLSGAAKHGSRAGWAVALRRSGVDEILRVDGHGRFTEGMTAAIVAVVDGALWTAAWDGGVLPSTTVASLERHATQLGVPVHRQGPSARGPWDTLYIASVTRGLARVAELDGEQLTGADPIGAALHASLA